jgi:hypothetical protein
MALSNIARAYREAVYEIKTGKIQSYNFSLNQTSPYFTISDGGRNIAGLELEWSLPLTAAAAENHVANTFAEDLIQRLEIVRGGVGDALYQMFLNYSGGANANRGTRPLTRVSVLFYNDADSVTDTIPDFGGAGGANLVYRVRVPIGIPAGAGFKVRFTTLAAITTLYAADVTAGLGVFTIRPLTTDAPVQMWEVKTQSFALVVGRNTINDRLPQGAPLVGYLAQTVTPLTAADISLWIINKNGVEYRNDAYAAYVRGASVQYVPALVADELLDWIDPVVWDLSGEFAAVLTANAGNMILTTFHPSGGTSPTPGAQAGAAAAQAPATQGASPPATVRPSQATAAPTTGIPATFAQARSIVRARK